MWIITHINTGKKYYLISEVKKYVVGRVGSDIEISNDTSISRSHAVFYITETSLKLEDTGSKYGTCYNEHIETKTKLPKGKPVELKEGDRVLFGALKNEWLISKSNITTMVSSLNGSQTSEVKSLLNALGGKIISKWEPSCTHLTMSEITITIKVLHALIEKIPIVSCEYWKQYLKDLRETKQPPKVNLYLPKRSASLSSAINVANFNFNDKRKSLFAGKTFIFMSKKHYDTYSPIVLKAGGECKDLKSNIPKSYLLQKNVIVIQYVASTQSQGSQTINTISEFLEANSIRTIPEYEIGLAIVCCTTEKYCNPSYNTISHILPNSMSSSPNIGTVLAENTRSQKSQLNSLELSMVEIPDSDYTPAKTGKPLQSEIYEESQQNVITIENSEDIECIAEASDTHNKRKRHDSDTNERENSSLKKINISSQNTFSENLNSSDIISNESEFPAPSELSKTKSNRKRSTPVIDCELQTSKKAHISTTHEKVTSETLKPHFPTTKNGSVILSNAVESNVPEKSKKPIGNSKNANKPFLQFLQKSQITPSQAEVQTNRTCEKSIENNLGATKRGRIALITDNDSNNEDDIFNFGSSPKKSKASGYNRPDEDLFAFGDTPCEDTADDAANKGEEDLAQTQRFIPQKKMNSKVVLHNIKVSPLKIPSDGWLSKLNLLQIKEDKDADLKKENDVEDPQRREWIDSIKGGFEVRVRKMNLSSKGNNYSTISDASDASVNTTKKNFKAFVKKQNFKPQTIVIRTVPMVVPPMH